MPESSVCQTEEKSLICEKIHNPEQADLLLQIANVEALKNEVYTAEQAISFLNEAEVFLQEVRTYPALAQWLASNIKEYQLEALVLSGYMTTFQNVDLPIYDFDRHLLLEHIKRQKRLVQNYLEQ